MDFLSSGIFWMFFALVAVFMLIFEIGYSGRGTLTRLLSQLFMGIANIALIIIGVLSFIFMWWQGGVAILISGLIWMMIDSILANIILRMPNKIIAGSMKTTIKVSLGVYFDSIKNGIAHKDALMKVLKSYFRYEPGKIQKVTTGLLGSDILKANTDRILLPKEKKDDLHDLILTMYFVATHVDANSMFAMEAEQKFFVIFEELYDSMKTKYLEKQSIPNWFQRHLNWTSVFSCFLWFVLIGISKVYLLQYSWEPFVAAFVGLIIPSWILKQKKRDLWWLLLSPIGSPLWLKNKKIVSQGRPILIIELKDDPKNVLAVCGVCFTKFHVRKDTVKFRCPKCGEESNRET